MTTQAPKYIQTITAMEPINTIEDTDPTDIVEVEGVLVNEPRIKPIPISVVPRLLSHTTTIQVDLIEVTADGQPNIITREPQDEDEYSPRLIYCSYYTCCSCCSCCSCCRCYTCYVSKECALCIGSFACVAAMVLTGIH